MDDLFQYLLITDQLDDFLGFKKNYKCPNCGDKLVEIVYGRPTPDVVEKAKQKKLYLGGCNVGGSNPNYHCYGCNKNYYENGKEAR